MRMLNTESSTTGVATAASVVPNRCAAGAQGGDALCLRTYSWLIGTINFFEEKSHDPEQWGLYDWGHSEANSLFLGPVWIIRAAAFDHNNVPRPRMNNEWMHFWERFDIDEDAVLYYADSNVKALTPEVRSAAAARTAQVWLYDAHHDSGYRENRDLKDVMKTLQFSCEDWMVGYHLFHQSELHVRYPTWKTWAMDGEPEPLVPVDRCFDNGLPNDVHFDTVFVCRSGAWTPPWCDRDFEDFITDAPVDELYELEECQPREWDEGAVKTNVALLDQVYRSPGAK
jgi:hypothetical protein